MESGQELVGVLNLNLDGVRLEVGRERESNVESVDADVEED
jgi:hypothetical protein